MDTDINIKNTHITHPNHVTLGEPIDISDEKWRQYHYPEGHAVLIANPSKPLHRAQAQRGGLEPPRHRRVGARLVHQARLARHRVGQHHPGATRQLLIL